MLPSTSHRLGSTLGHFFHLQWILNHAIGLLEQSLFIDSQAWWFLVAGLITVGIAIAVRILDRVLSNSNLVWWHDTWAGIRVLLE